jgi:predicted RNase H-like HicB family nuclease
MNSNQSLESANPSIEIKVELVPVVKVDKKTGLYVAYFEQFQKASASGKTEKEAIASLQEIFKIMWNEQKDDIIRQLAAKYSKITGKQRNQSLKDLNIVYA